MKKNLILIVLLAVTAQAFGQKANTVVTGKLNGLQSGEWIFLDSFGSGGRDSVQHTNGSFRFEKNIPEGAGGFYILRVGKSMENLSFIFLEQGKLHIRSKTSHLRDAKYSGGKLADYYNMYRKRPAVEGMGELSQQLTAARQNNEAEKVQQISAALETKRMEQKELDKAFVAQHPSSPAAVYVIYFSLRDRNNLDELERILAQVAPAAKNNLPIKQIEHSIRTEKLTGIGKTALPFSQKDTTGRIVSLNDFRGKYVLIDFWASWCVPCRIENPNVVAAHEQYKNKNFTVLGISFDNPGQHGRWMQAIHDDNLHWTQLSDLKGWNNEVGKLYDIRSIPSSLLIDPNGVIVAKNLKGEKLEEKLRELLGAPQLDPGTFMINGKVDNPDQAEWFHIQYVDRQGKTVNQRVRIFNGVFSYLGKLDGAVHVSGYFVKGSNTTIPPVGQQVRFDAAPGIFNLTGNAETPSAITISRRDRGTTTKVTGYIQGLEDSEITFHYLVDGARKADSVQTTGGRFTWEAPMSEPQKVGIMFPSRYAEFYAEAGVITISGQADSLHMLKVSGSALQDEAMAYQNAQKDLTDQRSALYRQYGQVSAAEQRQLEEKLEQLRTSMRARAREYVQTHPSSYYSFDLVNDRAAMGAYEEVKPLFDILNVSIQQSAQGRVLAERLDILKRSAIGATMLDFTQNDTEGNPVQFSSFNGKYVLVDFWASWCGPCRAENPKVLKEYNKYKDQNFTVVGVSLDDNADRWKKAIEEDGMPWTQVSDLKGWRNEVSTYYGIQGIPSTLLVDPNGKIIAKDLRGELLAKKLEEIFN